MFGISGEHLLILGIILLIFGPKRLPELGNTLGKAIRNFKDSISGVEEAKFRKIEAEAEQGRKTPGPDLEVAGEKAADPHQPAGTGSATGTGTASGTDGTNPPTT